MKIGIIGIGNIGGIFVKRLTFKDTKHQNSIFIYDVNAEKISKCAKETEAKNTVTIKELGEKSDIVILAVKPNVVEEVLNELKDSFDTSKILISVAAGVPIKLMERIMGTDKKIVRTMPNTPAMIGEGVTAICWNENVLETDIEIVKHIFELVGKVELLSEKYFDVITAISGSSPAYVFMFIESMADAAVLCGLQRDQAYRLASQAVVGAAKMLIESGKHPGELKDQVCSPAGTTIEGVKILEKNSFRYSIFEAVVECAKKAGEIEKRFS